MKTLYFSWGGNIGFRMGEYDYNASIYSIDNIPDESYKSIYNEISKAIEYENHNEMCMDYMDRRTLVFNRIDKILEKYNLPKVNRNNYRLSACSSWW